MPSRWSSQQTRYCHYRHLRTLCLCFSLSPLACSPSIFVYACVCVRACGVLTRIHNTCWSRSRDTCRVHVGDGPPPQPREDGESDEGNHCPLHICSSLYHLRLPGYGGASNAPILRPGARMGLQGKLQSAHIETWGADGSTREITERPY